MRNAWVRLCLGCIFLAAGGNAFCAELQATGRIDQSICDDHWLTSPPPGFDVNVATAVAPRGCQFPRPPGHIVLLGPPSRSVGGISLAHDGGRLSNLAVIGDGGYCLPPELQSRPVIGACAAQRSQNKSRPGLSRHYIGSLHDNETEIAQISAVVEPNEVAPLIIEAEFDIDPYSPDLGADFHQEIRRHFIVRVERADVSGTSGAISQDYPLDIAAVRKNRILTSFPIARQERITATLVFTPIHFRRLVTNGFQSKNSASITLQVSLSKFAFTRGLPPDSIFEAVRDNDLAGLRTLLEANPDLAAVDRSGLTALGLARWLGKDTIAAELAARDAPDNRSTIIFGPVAGLIQALRNDVPPQALVTDIMANKLILRPPDAGGGASNGSSLQPMAFGVHAVLEPDGCDKSEINFGSSAPSRDDDKLQNVACSFSNPTAGWVGVLAPMTSIATFDAYRLATLASSDPRTRGATVYTAHTLSGAYGAMRYSGVWPFGTSHDRTARIRYSIKGSASIPACTDPSRCSVLRSIWYEERHEGDGFSSSVIVSQPGAAAIPLVPNTPVELDLSRGPVKIDLSLTRDYSHLGAACCKTLQQSQLLNIYVAGNFRISAFDSIMRGTHSVPGRPIGEEYAPLTEARAEAIVQAAQGITATLAQIPGLPPPPLPDRRPFELALAQYHDDASHPHSARFSDLYLRLVLLDALQSDKSVSLNAGERRLMELIERTLTAAARSLYLPETMRQFSDIKAKALRLHLPEAKQLASLLDADPDAPLSEGESLAVSSFLELLSKQPAANSADILAQLGGPLDRAKVAGALLEYVEAAIKELRALENQARGLAIEIGQFRGIDPKNVDMILQELSDVRS